MVTSSCRRNDTTIAQMMRERVIDVLLDIYHNDEAGMFESPTVTEEREIQIAMIRSLAGKYGLDKGLRRKLRSDDRVRTSGRPQTGI